MRLLVAAVVWPIVGFLVSDPAHARGLALLSPIYAMSFLLDHHDLAPTTGDDADVGQDLDHRVDSRDHGIVVADPSGESSSASGGRTGMTMTPCRIPCRSRTPEMRCWSPIEGCHVKMISYVLRACGSIPGALIWHTGEVVGQFEQVAVRSLPIVLGAGLSVGLVAWLQTHRLLVEHGAESTLPSFLAVAVLVEIGPVLAGLLVASRMGAGLAAELGSMLFNEEIDARSHWVSIPFRVWSRRERSRARWPSRY